MDQIFSNAGEFRRGKGSRKSRFGPRIRLGQREGGKKTPNEIARDRLTRYLTRAGVPNPADYAKIMEEAEMLRFMSMPVLAEVFRFLHDHWPLNAPADSDFTQKLNYSTLSPYIEDFLRRQKNKGSSDEDPQVVRLRLAATFLRYIRYVFSVRSKVDESMDQARYQALATEAD